MSAEATTETLADEARERAQRGSRQHLIARACVVGCGFIATATLTRTLEPAAYGIYGVVISQLLYAEMLMNAGIPGATAKLIADGHHGPSQVERSARAVLVVWAALLCAIGWVLAPWVANLMRIPDGALLLRIALLDLPLMAIFMSYDAALTGRRQFSVRAAAHVAYGITKLTVIIALIAIGITIERAVAAYVISTGIVAAALMAKYRLPGLRPLGTIVRQILMMAGPIGVFLIAIQVLLSLDLWSLKTLWTGDSDVVGYFVASLNLARVLMIVSGAQSGIVFASVARALSAGDTGHATHHIQDATRFALIIAAGAWVLLASNASAVLGFLYSQPYAGGEHFLPVQLAAVATYAMLDILAHALIAAGRPWWPALAVSATIPLAWLANMLLIPWLGPIGAALSQLSGFVIAAAIIGTLAYRRFGTLVRGSMLLRVVGAAAVVGVASVLWPAHGVVVIVKLGVLGCLYLAILFWLGEITAADFRVLKKRSTA